MNGGNVLTGATPYPIQYARRRAARAAPAAHAQRLDNDAAVTGVASEPCVACDGPSLVATGGVGSGSDQTGTAAELNEALTTAAATLINAITPAARRGEAVRASDGASNRRPRARSDPPPV